MGLIGIYKFYCKGVITILLNLNIINLQKIAQVGGKAANLGELINAGFNVPKGFVCTDIGVDDNKILNIFDELNLSIVAVRSSAICEDGENNSFAGQFDTILNVNKNTLIKSIKQCFQSCNNQNVIEYASEKNVSQSDTKVAVVVQQMIKGDISGVMFTHNPINGENSIMIEFIKGTGEQLVQGEITPSHVVISRDGEIKQYFGESTLKQEKLIQLLNLGLKIEDYYAAPQDVEWTIKDNIIYILQSRPITKISI